MTLAQAKVEADKIDAVLISARSVTSSISSLANEAKGSPGKSSVTPIRVPGWQVIEPTAEQISEVRKFIQADSVPGEDQYRFVLPNDADVNVICTRGSVAIYDLDETTPLTILHALPGLNFHYAPRGSKRSMQAQGHPTQVLCVAWRERGTLTDGSVH